MFTGIRWRLISYFLIIIAFIVLIMGAFFIWFLNNLYIQTLQENLYIQTRLTGSLIEEMIERGSLRGEIDAVCKDLSEEFGVRITLMDSEGVVWIDSASDPSVVENQRHHPEIIEALQHGMGVSVRFSTTLGEYMLYLAVPFPDGSGWEAGAYPLAGVIRLALPLYPINAAIANLRLFILGFLLFASLLALGIGVILSHRIIDPLQKIVSAAQAISAGNYRPLLEVSGRDELTELAQNIKSMGHSLDKKIHQVLREKNKLETVISSINSGIILVDHTLTIEMINPAAEKLFGIEREKVVGTPLQTTLRHYSLLENLKAVLRGSAAKLIELNIFYPRVEILEVYLIPVAGVRSSTIGVLLLFHEVTHLRSLDKMRSDFVANVSHELRTPLAVIRGYTETILHEKLSQNQLFEFLQIIDRETGRLSSLLDSLLDLAQIENEREVVKKEQVDLSALLAEVLLLVEGIRLQKEIALSADITCERAFVLVNREWMGQALVNILENSIKHGNHGGELNVRLYSEHNIVTVEVEDNGPGIPEADLPYVFERFYRVDKARSRKSGGTGLGLSIVKHVMEAHNAVYGLESKEGKGTTFRFSLKLTKT